MSQVYQKPVTGVIVISNNRPEEIKGSMDVLIDPNSKYPFRFRNINIISDYDKDINEEKFFIPHGFYYNLNESFYHKLKNINIIYYIRGGLLKDKREYLPKNSLNKSYAFIYSI